MRVSVQRHARKLDGRRGAPGGELVLENQEVEHVEAAVAGEVGANIARGEEVLKLQKIEDIKAAITGEIGAALGPRRGRKGEAGRGRHEYVLPRSH